MRNGLCSYRPGLDEIEKLRKSRPAHACVLPEAVLIFLQLTEQRVVLTCFLASLVDRWLILRSSHLYARLGSEMRLNFSKKNRYSGHSLGPSLREGGSAAREAAHVSNYDLSTEQNT